MRPPLICMKTNKGNQPIQQSTCRRGKELWYCPMVNTVHKIEPWISNKSIIYVVVTENSFGHLVYAGFSFEFHSQPPENKNGVFQFYCWWNAKWTASRQNLNVSGILIYFSSLEVWRTDEHFVSNTSKRFAPKLFFCDNSIILNKTMKQFKMIINVHIPDNRKNGRWSNSFE